MHRGGHGRVVDHRRRVGIRQAANVVLIYPQPYGSGCWRCQCDLRALIFVHWSPCAALACADGQRLVSRLEAYLTSSLPSFSPPWLTVSRRLWRSAGRRQQESVCRRWATQAGACVPPGEARRRRCCLGDVVEGAAAWPRRSPLNEANCVPSCWLATLPGQPKGATASFPSPSSGVYANRIPSSDRRRQPHPVPPGLRSGGRAAPCAFACTRVKRRRCSRRAVAPSLLANSFHTTSETIVAPFGVKLVPPRPHMRARGGKSTFVPSASVDRCRQPQRNR